jgi:hypothetical protein
MGTFSEKAEVQLKILIADAPDVKQEPSVDFSSSMANRVQAAGITYLSEGNLPLVGRVHGTYEQLLTLLARWGMALFAPAALIPKGSLSVS